MSFLALTLPLSLLLAAILTAMAIRAVLQGQYDDWEGPAWRHLHDDDHVPEREENARHEVPQQNGATRD